MAHGRRIGSTTDTPKSAELKIRGELAAQRDKAERLRRMKDQEKIQNAARREQLSGFAEKDTVTNGVQKAKVVSLDRVKGFLLVRILPFGREQTWSPQFVSKV